MKAIICLVIAGCILGGCAVEQQVGHSSTKIDYDHTQLFTIPSGQ